jgi:PAS domain S-box-containing protein
MTSDPDEAQQLLRMLRQHNPDAIWMVSPDWTEVKFVGNAFSEIYNRPIIEEEEERIDFLKGVHPDDRETVKEALSLLSEGESVDAEYRTNPSEGFQRHVWLKAEQIYDSDGELAAIGGFSRDITERKRQERQLRRKNDRLEKFANIISHDVRNPLNTATGHLNLAREEADSDYLDKVAESLERMDEIISDTLTLAKQGKTVAETEEIDLESLANESWEEVYTADKSLIIDQNITLRGDRGRLKHVFENLFRNATEHNDASITVSVGLIETFQLSTRGSDSGQYDGFYVEDDGSGIPDADQADVFSTSYSTGGTGLGLPIVEDIVEAHGWSIDVRDSPDGGARFRITGVDTAIG